MILKQITSLNPDSTKKEKVEQEKTVFGTSDAKKQNEERAGSSFMIDDILGRKSLPETSENSNKLNDRRLIISAPKLQDVFPDQINECVGTSCHSISSQRYPIKPTPMLLSPLCTGFMRFGIFSPTVYPNHDHNIFTFPTNDSANQIDNQRNEQMIRSTVFRPSRFLEFSNNGIKPLEASIVTVPNAQSDCVTPRTPIFWKHILHRNTPKRKGGQIRFSSEQTSKLEKTFSEKKYLSPTERKRLASLLRLTERQVKTWFQNRRAKWRRLKQEHSTHTMNPSSDENVIVNHSMRTMQQ